MTLIFSNSNRILFNIEESHQLLRLAYGNRFTALLKDQKVYKQKSTPYKAYLSKTWGSKLYPGQRYKALTLLGKRALRHKAFNPYNYKAVRTRFTSQAELQIPYKSTYKASHTNLRFVRTALTDLRFVWARTCKSPYVPLRAITSTNLREPYPLFGVTGGGGGHARTAHTKLLTSTNRRFVRSFVLPLQIGDLYLYGHMLVRDLYEICKGVRTRQIWPLFGLYKRGLAIATKKCNCLLSNNFKEKLHTLKLAVPKLSIWSFAFGSSFFFVSISSIFQRREQTHWFFTFSRSQLPGLYLTSQNSSWECFENITLKYLSRKSLPYSEKNAKNSVKKIDCYKDIWYLYFSESWNQESIQNYTAVFSKFGQHTPDPKTYFTTTSMSKGYGGSAKSEVILGNTEKDLDSKENRALTKPRFVRRPTFVNQRIRLGRDLSLNNEWIVQPWYQMHARVPPRKSLMSIKGSKTRLPVPYVPYPYTNKGRVRRSPGFQLSDNPSLGRHKAKLSQFSLFKTNSLKEGVFIETDSIPSKMSSAIRYKYNSNNKRLASKACSHKNILYPFREKNAQSQLHNDQAFQHRERSRRYAKTDTLPVPVPPKRVTKGVKRYNRAHTGRFFIDSPNDIIKALFYESNNFSIEPKAFQTVSQDTPFLPEQSLSFAHSPKVRDKSQSGAATVPFWPWDFVLRRRNIDQLFREQSKTQEQNRSFEKGIGADRFSFLQKETFFCLPNRFVRDRFNVTPFFCKVGKDDDNILQNQTFQMHLKQDNSLFNTQGSPYLPKEFSSCKASELLTNFKGSRLKSGERMWSYLLFKQKTISNRDMSGYKKPETKDLQLKRKRDGKIWTCNSGLEFSIKVPPALPFSESKITALRGACNPFFQKAFVRKGQPLCLGACVPPKPLANEASRFFAREGKMSPKKRSIDHVTALKKMPYRELCLNEKGEIEPLFEKVNRMFRISPYQFAFKRSLFANYNDYLSWPKDNPVAISINPFLSASGDEEEGLIQDSWLAFSPETKDKTELVPSEDSKSFLHTEERASNKALLYKPETNQTVGLDDTILQQQGLPDSSKQRLLEKDLSSQKKEKEESTFLFEGAEQFDSQSGFGEGEEKKREVTKAEWLDQIRKSEQLLEKRKDLQKIAYPNKKALANRDLQIEPGRIQNLLVSDRKASFFGITNLFPKRLVSQDQKDINRQILREDQDRRSVSLLKSLAQNDRDGLQISGVQPLVTQKTDELAIKGQNPIFVEDLLKSRSLYYHLFAFKNQEVPATSRSTTAGANLLPSNSSDKARTDSGETKQGLKIFQGEAPFYPSHQKPCFVRASTCTCKPLSFKKARTKKVTRQHPVYTPNRRLRLRVPQSSLSSQNTNSQARIDDLNLSSSHRWWQKRRIASSLLGAPSKRYVAMPEITTQDWRKIIEWQLKIYFLEEEKRLLQNRPFYEKNNVQKDRGRDTKPLFKIKKLAVYLPWTTLKKSLKKPFEWPVTGLSYSSSEKPFGSGLWSNRTGSPTASTSVQSFVKNKKMESCFVSSIAPGFKSSPYLLSNQSDTSTCLSTKTKSFAQSDVYKPFLFEAKTKNSYLLFHGLALAIAVKGLFNGLYKIFGKIVLAKIKDSSLSVLLLPLLLNSFGSSSRGVNQIYSSDRLKKRLKDLAGNEDTISSLSEIVWYLRNSCRGRLIPRGVVLVEKFSSETTSFLKAIGGEAQVPVIVQSLRALPFTQNHPQRQLERILTFAQKQAPCILFLDDLDSIGKARTLLLKNSYGSSGTSKKEPSHFSVQHRAGASNRENLGGGGNSCLQFKGEGSWEKTKWKRNKNDREPTQRVRGQSGNCSLFRSSRGIQIGNLHRTRLQNSALYEEIFTDAYKSSSKSEFYNNKGEVQNRAPKDAFELESFSERTPMQNSETDKLIEQRRVDLMLRLLTVMDGISSLNGVLIVTTSKNPSSLDPALLRPGRFEKLIAIKLPNKKKRISLLKRETAKIGHTNPMPWQYLGTQTQNMTGTEIASAINHSAFRAIIQSTVHTFPTLEYGINCTNVSSYKSEVCKAARGEMDASTCPYKSTCKRFAIAQGEKERSDQISFYKAGKGVIQALFLNGIESSFCGPWSSVQTVFPINSDFKIRKKKKNARPQRGLGWLCKSPICNCHQGIVANDKLDRLSLTRADFAERLICLYAGQAALALYLKHSYKASWKCRCLQEPYKSLYKYKSHTNLRFGRALRACRTSTNQRFVWARACMGSLCFVRARNKICTCKANKPEAISFCLSNAFISPEKLFLGSQSNFSYKEHLQARFTVEEMTSRFRFYPKTKKQPQSSLFTFNSPPRKLCSLSPSRKKIGFSRKENGTDFLYYNMVLSCFYAAFQNCTENRELLDFVADHLIRFKLLKTDEIMRIALFYH